jgi:hypothetical protein
MGLFDRFKSGGSKQDQAPPDAVLKNLRPGWLLDYDLKSWEVKAYNTYTWGREVSYEWQIASGDDIKYLELEIDDEEYWSLSNKIAFSRLGPEVRQAILDNGDPPEELVFEGVTYYLEEMAGGQFKKDGIGEGQDLLRWSYEDDDGDRYLGIEQWGETDFEASTGIKVEEYQFSNILPRI